MASEIRKADRRDFRLVRRRVAVEVRHEGRVWRGRTTGLNERGLGARLKPVASESTAAPAFPLPGSPIEVTFLDPALAAESVTGTVLRFEPSWELGYPGFAALGFDGADRSVSGRIRDLAAREKSASTIDGPVREWYVSRDGQSAGPMTAVEVHACVERGDLRPTDFAWDAPNAAWLPLASFASLVTSAPTTAPTMAPIVDTTPQPRRSRLRGLVRTLLLAIALLLALLLARVVLQQSSFRTVSSFQDRLASVVSQRLPIFATLVNRQSPGTITPAPVVDLATPATPIAPAIAIPAAPDGPTAQMDVPPAPPLPLPYQAFASGTTVDPETWKDRFGTQPGGATVDFGRMMVVTGNNDHDMWGRVYRRVSLDMAQNPILEIDVEDVSHQGYILLSGNHRLPHGYLRLNPTITGPGRYRFALRQLTGLAGVQGFQLEVGVTNEGARTNRNALMALSSIRLLAE